MSKPCPHCNQSAEIARLQEKIEKLRGEKKPAPKPKKPPIKKLPVVLVA